MNSTEFLGLQDYTNVAQKQGELANQIRGTKRIHLLGMEFHPVITLGIRGDRAADLMLSTEDIPVVETDRGGQATLHSPGQLVIYPMMDIKAHGVGVRDFVCLVTKATTKTLSDFEIESFSAKTPGIYTRQGKIAFLGIRLDAGVVRHGISLNVTNETSLFSSIKSCGVMSAKIDRMQNYPTFRDQSLESLFIRWSKAFDFELELLQRANGLICGLQTQKEPLSIEVHNSRADMA